MKINKELINSLITNVSNEVDLTREQYEKLENIFNNVIGTFLLKRSSTDIEIDDEITLRVHMINVFFSNKQKEHSEVYLHELNHGSEPEMKSNLKDNIWIEGFDTTNELVSKKEYFPIIDGKLQNIIYSGKTSEIPEEIIQEVLQLHPYSYGKFKCYFEYDNPSLDLSNISTQTKNNPRESRNDHLWSPRQSIISACDKEYCIIYKI